MNKSDFKARLMKYGKIIKELGRKPKTYSTEISDESSYRFPRTLEEAGEFIKRELEQEEKPDILDAVSNMSLSPCANCLQRYREKPKRISKQRRIVEKVIEGELIPIEVLRRISKENDPLSVWASEKNAWMPEKEEDEETFY